jgi:hypothetical protein
MTRNLKDGVNGPDNHKFMRSFQNLELDSEKYSVIIKSKAN